ncbi:YeiH family protein [Anaerorhabdus furcosa]|uniref:Conserved hypothetical integral membrane protein n=1 Tax=Anaerorhabdus furcosa TaxID=118967 RepID=A0A1T4MSK7_9FIRM|nr:putative sulfate exporter family transporter [Anaerorhabdus furcosa]SJZ69745.1 conserved hypothetical integral membrane protein [Anaerorhabdus furcosa]
MDKKYGVLCCLILAIIATGLSKVQSVISGPMIGLILGMIMMNIFSFKSEFLEGAKYCAKRILNLSIIFVGATLNLKQIIGYGGKAVPLLIINILIAFAVARYFGKKKGISRNTYLMIGGGTSICGGSAIATIASIIKAKEQEIAYAMAAIFFFDLLAAVAYPYLATILSLTPEQFGVFAGASINDTSSVAAAEATYNVLHGLDISNALTVKLTRTTLLLLVSLGLSFVQSKSEKETGSSLKLTKVLPPFILMFIVASLLNTFGVFELASETMFNSKSYLPSLIKDLSKFLMTIALCGVGFKIKFNTIFQEGKQAVILGGITWVSLFVSTLIAVKLFF